MTSVLANLIPRLANGLAILACALVCVLPWGGNSDVQIQGVGAALPLALVFALGFWQPALTHPAAVFLAGLLVDAVTGGPLGYWPLLYLSVLAMARFATSVLDGGGLLLGWLSNVMAVGLVSLLAMGVRSIYHLEAVSWSVVAWPLLGSVLLFPFAALGFNGALRWRARRERAARRGSSG